MVRNNPLKRSKLLGKSQSIVDEELLKVGFTSEELRILRSYTDRELRIKSAAKALMNNTGFVESLTVANLGYVLARNSGTIGEQLVSVYEGELREYELLGLKVNYVHCLREDLGFYQGNVREARGYWSGFESSNHDLLRSVRIPLTIDSTLLGVIWGDGSTSNNPKKQLLSLHGTKSDGLFYKEWLAPRLEQEFNLPVKEYIRENKSSSNRFGSNSFTDYYININSKAIVTWLVRDLGFPGNKGKTNVQLPIVSFDDHSFLEGIIASMGSQMSDSRIKISEKDYSFIKNIRDLSEGLGYTPSSINKVSTGLDGETHSITFKKSEISTMNLVNPKHQY